MTSSLITEGEDFVEYLRNMSAHVPWETFECFRNGNYTIAGVIFKMRVGLHMNRPSRAIIALGHFVRMEKYEVAYEFKKLTPEAPDTCLYYIPETRSDHKGILSWHPLGWTRKRDEHSEPEKDYTILDASAFFSNLGRGKWQP